MIDPTILEAFRCEYMKGKSVKAVAAHFNVPNHTLEVICTKEGWKATKALVSKKHAAIESEISGRTMEKVADKLSSRISSHLESMIEGSFALRKSLLDNMMNQCVLPVIVDHASHAQAVNSLVKIDDMARKSLGLNDVQELKVTGSIEATLSILNSCRSLVDSGKAQDVVVDVQALLDEAKDSEGK